MQEKAGKAFSLPATKRLLFVAGFAHLQGIQAPEGVQGATGKPPGRLRRGETFCDAEKIWKALSLAQEIYFLWQVPCAAGGPKVSKGRPESPLVASAEAKLFVIRKK